MRFDLSRLDGDPTYAPGLFRSGKYLYWRPSPHLVKAGYLNKKHPLPGLYGDDRDADRAAMCRAYTRDMLQWASGQQAPKVEEGTWLWLIGRYKSDEHSPFQDVKANTREDYLNTLARLEVAIGSVKIAATDLAELKGWKKAMGDNFTARAIADNLDRKEKGLAPRPTSATSYVKRGFTMIRILAGYGKMIKATGARDVVDILSEMVIKSPRRRTVTPKPDQVLAVIAAADDAKDAAFALGLSFQWWLTLRAVDVRGQWLGKGDGRRWADGLTWDMFDRDLTTLTKTPSKTEDDMPEELVFDLTLIPDLQARLKSVPQDQRIGPVIKQPNGRPFDRFLWADRYRLYARKAGVPDEIKMMDTRSGALNHAQNLGASPFAMRDQANHSTIETTNRYIRERSENANKVIELRARKTV